MLHLTEQTETRHPSAGDRNMYDLYNKLILPFKTGISEPPKVHPRAVIGNTTTLRSQTVYIPKSKTQQRNAINRHFPLGYACLYLYLYFYIYISNIYIYTHIYICSITPISHGELRIATIAFSACLGKT